MTARLAHYWLDSDGHLQMAPPATRGACLPYFTERDGKVILHVIEGGAFHNYELDAVAVARLVAEGAALALTWARAAGADAPHGPAAGGGDR